MANDLKGENAISALGKSWILSLPFRSAKALKADHGIDIMSGGANLADLETFERVFAAMVRANQPEATDVEIEDIISEIGLKPAGEAMLPALAGLMGVPVDSLKAAADPQ